MACILHLLPVRSAITNRPDLESSGSHAMGNRQSTFASPPSIGNRKSKVFLAVIIGFAVGAPVQAADVPVHGQRLSLRAGQGEQTTQRTARVSLRDAAIAAPFPDPRLGAVLRLSGGAAVGQCQVELPLDPANWEPIGEDGTQRGYRFRDQGEGAHGVRRIVLRPGAISVRARGADWPCDLMADAQRVPVTIELGVADTRYCAAFAAGVGGNVRGRLLAGAAPAPPACSKTDLTVADLNILHGIACPRSTRSCRLEERIDLLFQWIVRAGCPDVVTLQEVSTQAQPLLTARLADACPFEYAFVYKRTSLGVDDEMVLSRFPIVTSEVHPLYHGFRTVLFARIDHPIGAVDIFSTHLASSSDGAQLPCEGDCPPECVAAGAATVRECQSVQMAGFVAARHDVPGPAVATGDYNASPDSFVYDQFTSRGWTDVYLAAGNPECDPLTGVGCTSGRQDEDLSELESSASNEDERIDYIFLIPPASGSACAATIDSGVDGDGDGLATRIFADDPNPFAPACGPAPEPICWPSDHEGMQLDLNCRADASPAS